MERLGEAVSLKARAAELLASSPESDFTQDELHERLVEFDADYLEYESDIERPVIEIISDTTICIEGKEIELSSTQRFFMNALRIYQGHSLKRGEIADMGYRQSDANFLLGANDLLAKIVLASDSPIVLVTRLEGRGRQNVFELLPEVEVRDRRTELGFDSKQEFIEEAVEVDETGLPLVDDVGSIRFKSPRYRVRATVSMLAEFKQDGQFERFPPHFFRAMGQRALGRTILPLVPDEKLEHEEEQMLLAKKEEALAIFLKVGECYTEAERDIIIDGVNAFHTLFARNVDLLDMFAHKRSAFARGRFDESYQRCAEAMLDTIMRIGFDASGEALELRLCIVAAIRRAFYSSKRTEEVSAATIGASTLKAYLSTVKLLMQRGHEVNDDTVAKHMGASRAVVVALRFALDEAKNYDDLVTTPDGLCESDFVDEVLDRMEREDIIADILAGDGLTTKEKVVLSLYYGLFCSSLCGEEVATGEGGVALEYPRTQEAFEEMTCSVKDLNGVAQLLAVSYPTAAETRRAALRKARILLQNNPAFDDYGRVSSRQVEAETQEREDLIRKALSISPGEPLSERDIGRLSQEGYFPRLSRIEYLFGSAHEFRAQCGFAPDKKVVTSSSSNEDIILRAQQANPGGNALRGNRLEELVAEGILPQRNTIKRRFGSLEEFNRQCGFTYSAVTNEDIVRSAQEANPERTRLGTTRLEQLAKEGSLPQRMTIIRRFGSTGEFNRQCGFAD